MKPGEYWYQWHPALYRAATRHLTDMQDLYYRRLIDEYMESGEPLPDNDTVLAKIAGTSVENWLEICAPIRRFFVVKGDKLHQNFCNDLLNTQHARSKTRSKIAKKAANSRWNKNKEKQEDECIEHTGSMLDAMLGDAKGQDRTGQEKILGSNNHSNNKSNIEVDASPAAAGSAKKIKGSRLPEGWKVSEDLGKWALEQGLDSKAILREQDKFRNYWHAKTGNGATKADWDKTFKNWIYNMIERAR